MPADGFEHLAPRLAFRFETTRRRGPVQHGQPKRRVAGPVPKLGLIGIPPRVVPPADIMPVARLVRWQPKLHRPAIEQCRDALDVREPALAYTSPGRKLDGGRARVSAHRFKIG